MSQVAKASASINWDITTRNEFGPEEYWEKKLGNFFNDFWCLKLFKKPVNGNKFHIMLLIERKRAESNIKVTINLEFTDPQRKISCGVEYIKRFQHVDITKAEYCVNKKAGSMFVTADTIHVTGVVVFEEIQKTARFSSPETLNKLSTDLNKLCCSNIFSDVVLRCGSDVFDAHKNILATRCPVFADIIENCANDDAKIDITDLNSDVVKAVLLFIYTGETGPMTFQFACELLDAADRYCLIELKSLCVNHITSSLSVENVLEYFYKFDSAKSYALEFIAENIAEVKKTAQWQNFKRHFPDLLLKLGDSSEIEHIKQEITGPSNIKTEDIKQEDPGPSNIKTEEIKKEGPGPLNIKTEV